jgi:hypothetical protein
LWLGWWLLLPIGLLVAAFGATVLWLSVCRDTPTFSAT